MLNYPEDSDEHFAALEAKLKPNRIRATLAFAGLYQITHEMIKTAVLQDVRNFFVMGGNGKAIKYENEQYTKNVSSLYPKNKFRASLLWLVECEAITLAQADRLDEIFAHRNELSHELIKYVVDPRFEPDIQLMIDAIEILTAIRRFWTTIERDIGMFDGGIELDDVVPLSLIVLRTCIDAYLAGLPE